MPGEHELEIYLKTLVNSPEIILPFMSSSEIALLTFSDDLRAQ